MFDLPLQTLNQTMIQAFKSTHDIAIYPAWHNKNNLDKIITIKTLDKKQNVNQHTYPLQDWNQINGRKVMMLWCD